MVEPGFEPGNLAPEFILGGGSREGSRVAQHWELEQVRNLNCNVRAEQNSQGKTRHQAASRWEVLSRLLLPGFGRMSRVGVD